MVGYLIVSLLFTVLVFIFFSTFLKSRKPSLEEDVHYMAFSKKIDDINNIKNKH